MADTMEDVMPHLLNPVATYRPDVPAGIGTDIGDTIQSHAVLGGPVVLLCGFWIILLGKIPQLLPGPALFPGAVVTAATSSRFS